MKQKLFMLLAAMLLGSASAFAQSESQKGDVNEDGVVDVADINAVIEIMNALDVSAESRTYYWYIGQENPMDMTEIEQIVDDVSSPGWRIIGATLPKFSKENLLWDGSLNKIMTGPTKQTTYIALPSTTIKMRSSGGMPNDYWKIKGLKLLENVIYVIYESPVPTKAFNNYIY